MPDQPYKPDLDNLLHGFWYSRILFAGQEIGVFDYLADGARTAEKIADALRIDYGPMEILLNALTALDLLQKSGDRYALNPELEDGLVTSRPGSKASMMAHLSHMWSSWGRLDEVLRKGRSRFSEGQDVPPQDTERIRFFIKAMYEASQEAAEELARRLDLANVERMLDLGGGSGSYCIALARRKPSLRATVFDRPLSLEVAREFIAAAGMEEQVDTHSGDALRDNLGTGYDLVLISQLLHAYSPDSNARIVAKGAQALAPGGLLIINDFALNEDRASPRHAAVFAVNMLVNTEAGRTYTVAEVTQWMVNAGLGQIRTEDLLSRSTLFYGLKRLV